MTTSSTGLRSIYENPPQPVNIPVKQEEEKPIITPIDIPFDEEIIEYFAEPPKYKSAEIVGKIGWGVLIGGAIISTLISIFQLLF